MSQETHQDAAAAERTPAQIIVDLVTDVVRRQADARKLLEAQRLAARERHAKDATDMELEVYDGLWGLIIESAVLGGDRIEGRLRNDPESKGGSGPDSPQVETYRMERVRKMLESDGFEAKFLYQFLMHGRHDGASGQAQVSEAELFMPFAIHFEPGLPYDPEFEEEWRRVNATK